MCDVLSFAGGAIGDEHRDEDLTVLFELHVDRHPDVDFLGGHPTTLVVNRSPS